MADASGRGAFCRSPMERNSLTDNEIIIHTNRRRTRALVWVGQGILALVLALFVWRSLAGHWAEFRSLSLEIRPRPAWLVSAALVVWATYAVLIAAWLYVLRGWGQRLSYRAGAMIWCVSNLGRYVPGKVWGVAGLAVLAQRAGVQGWAAAASALALQGLAVGTGGLMVAATAPNSVPAWAVFLALSLGAAAIVALVWEPGPRFLARFVPAIELRALPLGTALSAALITWASWLGYGVAFWLLARGLVGSELGLASATGVFAAAYIVGLLAIFAPGGVGVREVVLVALLTPAVGSGDAITLTVGSRLLLTVTETGAALAAFALTPRTNGDGDGRIRA